MQYIFSINQQQRQTIINIGLHNAKSIQTTTILLILCSNTGRTGVRIGYRDAFFQVFHSNCDLRELQKSTLWKLDQRTNNELHPHQSLHLFLEVISCSRSVPSRRIDFQSFDYGNNCAFIIKTSQILPFESICVVIFLCLTVAYEFKGHATNRIGLSKITITDSLLLVIQYIRCHSVFQANACEFEIQKISITSRNSVHAFSAPSFEIRIKHYLFTKSTFPIRITVVHNNPIEQEYNRAI